MIFQGHKLCIEIAKKNVMFRAVLSYAKLVIDVGRLGGFVKYLVGISKVYGVSKLYYFGKF